MKKTVTPLRSLCAALAALVLLVALAAPAFAADGFADLYYRMNDSAEVLTEDEDGVLLLVSIGDRKWHISTCGYGITAFTDAGIQYLGEQMTPDMADGDYAAAFHTFIQWADAYVTAAREGHPYDVDNMPHEPLSILYLCLALVIGLVTALIVTGVMKSRLKSVAPQRDATSYVRQGSMKLTNQRDLYLYREVHRTERPKESSSSDSGGSSTHTSSSGSTHGGGGGSF